MKDYQRPYPLFSLCGLNCGLCPMHLGKYCPGCGGGEGHQSCAIVKCSQQHGAIEYCYLCDEYPCQKYEGVTLFDSFITHKNMLKDFEKVKVIGLEAYQTELDEKIAILQHLLANFNDGRRKSFFCTAVNLLDLQDIKDVLAQIEEEIQPDMSLKEKSTTAVSLFQSTAEKRSISLKLNRKERKK
ncbi:MAG: DUF3795 domain-containing protein [Syntrophomonadaceae bacterium]